MLFAASKKGLPGGRFARSSFGRHQPPQTLLLEHVQQHGAENDHAENDALGVDFDLGQIHAVLDHGDDEGADERPENLPRSRQIA